MDKCAEEDNKRQSSRTTRLFLDDSQAGLPAAGSIHWTGAPNDSPIRAAPNPSDHRLRSPGAEPMCIPDSLVEELVHGSLIPFVGSG
jgi:hypothetical protein